MKEWLASFLPIFYLIILILIGYFAEKSRYVTNIAAGLSQLINKVTLPIMIIVSLSEQNISDIPISELITIASVAALAIIILLFVNYNIGKLIQVPVENQLLHSYLGSFGNVIFLAYPFISSLFGERGLLYAIIFSISNELILWSFGAYFLSRSADKNDVNGKWNIKYLLNPNTISFFIGISMLLLRIRLPEILFSPLERLGSATVPLSMIFIGSILTRSKLPAAIRCRTIWSICAIKLLIAPLIFIWGSLLLSLPTSYRMMFSVIALQISMPSQSSLSIIADRYQADSAYAAQTIFISTLLSSITLPLLYLICINVFKV